MSDAEIEKIVLRDLEEEVKDSYLRYSMSVIVSRALPDVRDGQKPSQRRILYAMRELGLSPTGKHRKCAKIAGDTSGDFHPHGETVVYPTLVRMAQGWVMQYPLVNGQGNFGSVDGDPPAAMRYTEARLTHAAVALMEDLEKETVLHVPNYDETKTEPTVFPAKFPALLCNGSSGIAVGMATNIPPHNLEELSLAMERLIDNPETSVEEILEVMPGPDFPTGGIICGVSGIRSAYHTGRGKLILRAVMDIEEQKNAERVKLVVSEIPYNVNKSALIQKIAGLVNDKTITAISDIRDESDKDGLRIVMDLKKGEMPEVLINQLYKYTEMQTTFGCNMLALDGGMPRTMGIKQMMQAWIDHRMEVVRARTRFILKKAESRAHILQGYLIALDHLDAIVRLIRGSKSRKDAQDALMDQYNFSERQAVAVLDLRLYQLTGLERESVETEYQEKLKEIAELKSILDSEKKVKLIIKEEMFAVLKKYPQKRRTQIQVEDHEDFVMEDLIPDMQMVVTISEDNYVKRMPITIFKDQHRGGQGITSMDVKKEDALKAVYIASTHDILLIFTNLGRCYWLKTWQVPETGRRAKGKPLVHLIEGVSTGEWIATVLCVTDFKVKDACILLTTRLGVIKKMLLDVFESPRRKGVNAIKIDEHDEVIAAHLCKPQDHIMLFTRDGMAVRFLQEKIRPLGRTARGVKGVTLRSKEDAIVSCEVVQEDDVLLIVCEHGYGKRSKVSEFRQTNRGGVGVRSILTSERNGAVVGALLVEDGDSVLLLSQEGQTVRIPVKEIRVMGRSTQGVCLTHLKEKDRVVGVQCIKEQRGE